MIHRAPAKPTTLLYKSRRTEAGENLAQDFIWEGQDDGVTGLEAATEGIAGTWEGL